jgi:hypothetical protein
MPFFMPTDVLSTNHLILQILRHGAKPLPYVMSVTGATASTVAGLLKRHLIVRSRKDGEDTVRLSHAGIAVVSAVSEAHARNGVPR